MLVVQQSIIGLIDASFEQVLGCVIEMKFFNFLLLDCFLYISKINNLC